MLEPGAMVEGYEMIRLAGSGAMCRVYEGRWPGQVGRVAIKVLNEEWCAVGEVCARFSNEARLLGSICHPHVVSLLAQARDHLASDQSGTADDDEFHVRPLCVCDHRRESGVMNER